MLLEFLPKPRAATEGRPYSSFGTVRGNKSTWHYKVLVVFMLRELAESEHDDPGSVASARLVLRLSELGRSLKDEVPASQWIHAEAVPCPDLRFGRNC